MDQTPKNDVTYAELRRYDANGIDATLSNVIIYARMRQRIENDINQAPRSDVIYAELRRYDANGIDAAISNGRIYAESKQ